jgi:hypothetical protein
MVIFYSYVSLPEGTTSFSHKLAILFNAQAARVQGNLEERYRKIMKDNERYRKIGCDSATFSVQFTH